MLPVPRHLSRNSRPRGEQDELRWAARPDARRRTRDAPTGLLGSHPDGAGRVGLGLLQYHEVLHGIMPGAHKDHRQRADPTQGTGG